MVIVSYFFAELYHDMFNFSYCCFFDYLTCENYDSWVYPQTHLDLQISFVLSLYSVLVLPTLIGSVGIYDKAGRKGRRKILQLCDVAYIQRLMKIAGCRLSFTRRRCSSLQKVSCLPYL